MKRFAEHQIAVVINTTEILMKKLQSFVFENGLVGCLNRQRGQDNLLSDQLCCIFFSSNCTILIIVIEFEDLTLQPWCVVFSEWNCKGLFHT